MLTTAKAPFRGDHVGSLLRPQTLKEARADYQKGDITKEALRALEDSEIARIVERQKEAGLKAVTDGEFRRRWWHLDFIRAIKGIRTYEVDLTGAFNGAMTKAEAYTVDSKLSFPKNHPFLADFAYLKSIAGDHVAKITIPGPNMIFYSGVVGSQPYLNNPAYPSLDEVAQDIVKVYQDAIQAFYDAGCRYLQLDDTSWGALFSPDFREKISAQGFDPDELVKKFADITVEAVAKKPADMAITLHICRGNFKSAWLYQGGYEPIAKELFSRVNVDAFFLEYDTDRAGDFSPLRFIQDQKVVLGLITSKTPELEEPAEIKARIEEATQYVNKDQLCLSPQCGFASTEEGNLLTEEEQWEKLRHVVRIAGGVWAE
ncbi:5-methyltetrahydropteroyltriglutamate--homocysteine S-methyltransferase [Lentibacillus sp. JNUCC-1]|uniref:5-methyltetrahydropteroyltriglutamate-- homocysteine S-methyltransferase n=1 Tax=Lentibacillus sp. JNUCC-1 TaxID=2654513 RepID=UPI0012E92F38|nr:5-methyltetrahydropteroyltriglutamate--homocysteine S-methyltransferase [Lentibacillus sp. JNUCC-1]MUV37859.1 5-methyltetrahydropteroyltriglutamate--homocysteine S-methyltransferase [Lentibacillus sp. JNUCC-1]